MFESISQLDPTTRELLTSLTPDISALEKGRFSHAANRDGLRTINRALELLNTHGSPSWERLGMIDPEVVWMAFSLNSKGDGQFPINRRIVRLMDAVVDLGSTFIQGQNTQQEEKN